VDHLIDIDTVEAGRVGFGRSHGNHSQSDDGKESHADRESHAEVEDTHARTEQHFEYAAGAASPL